jgi:hypothetical protein
MPKPNSTTRTASALRAFFSALHGVHHFFTVRSDFTGERRKNFSGVTLEQVEVARSLARTLCPGSVTAEDLEALRIVIVPGETVEMDHDGWLANSFGHVPAVNLARLSAAGMVRFDPIGCTWSATTKGLVAVGADEGGNEHNEGHGVYCEVCGKPALEFGSARRCADCETDGLADYYAEMSSAELGAAIDAAQTSGPPSQALRAMRLEMGRRLRKAVA